MKDWKFLLKKYVGRDPHPYHEPVVKKALLKLRGHLFVDVGSAWKPYTKLLSRNFDKTLTIDPNPKWHADMQIALADCHELRPFYIGDNEGGADSLIPNPYINGKTWTNRPTMPVNVRTWDELQLKADLVKIDVEGAEFMVLQGMQKFIPANLVVELHDDRLKHQLIKAGLEKGYGRAERIDETHWWFHE